MSHLERSPSFTESEPQENCGITGIISKEGIIVTHLLPQMNQKLINRGRDAAGMAAFDFLTGEISVYKGAGKVRELFPIGFDFSEHNLLSTGGIGHNRYGVDDKYDKDDPSCSQPMIAEYRGRKVAIAYNGNLPERERAKLKKRFPPDVPEGPNVDTSEILHAIITAEGENWEDRIVNGLNGVHLAYSLTILTDKGEIFGLRGPSGHWPLWVGEDESKIVLASETRVDELKGFNNIAWSEVEPGELVQITPEGIKRKQIFRSPGLFRCALHDIYGARRNSKMTETITHGDFRKQAGRILAREHPIVADHYVGIPETARDIVDGFTEELGTSASELIVKRTEINGDEARAYIGKDTEERNEVLETYVVKNKEKIIGKSIVTIDDSNIRGTTAGGEPLKIADDNPIKRAKGYIGLLRESGAARVDALFALSKFVDGCDMGYYIRQNQLVAVVRNEYGEIEILTEQQIADRIGADSVYYMSIAGVKGAYEWVYGRKDVACMRCMGQPHPLDIIEKNESEHPSSSDTYTPPECGR